VLTVFPATITNVDIKGWESRYRSKERAGEDFEIEPTKLVAQIARRLQPGKALDLACGTGRNALWLAQEGWDVTAVDGAAAAIETLQERARQKSVTVKTVVADLRAGEYAITPSQWDLITICYYLQRDLIGPAQNGTRPGGLLLVIVHTTEGDEQPTESRLRPGELAQCFMGWELLHNYEGKPDDPAHRRAVAEIVARRPIMCNEVEQTSKQGTLQRFANQQVL
jgi:SAM-dependent methyltransferase